MTVNNVWRTISGFLQLVIGLTLFIVSHSAVYAQEDRTRLAFVVGNNNYGSLTENLRNAINDANDIANKLKKHGYDIYADRALTNLTRSDFDRHWSKFVNQVSDINTASVEKNVVVFYAGHTLSSNTGNYLVPTDYLDIIEKENRLISLEEMAVKLDQNNGNGTNITLIDGCRNMSFADRDFEEGDELESGGFAKNTYIRNNFFGFAASKGQYALDNNIGGKNGLYTQELLKVIDTHSGRPIGDLHKQVTVNVRRISNEEQSPSATDELVIGGPHCLGRCLSSSFYALPQERESIEMPDEQTGTSGIKTRHVLLGVLAALIVGGLAASSGGDSGSNDSFTLNLRPPE